MTIPQKYDIIKITFKSERTFSKMNTENLVINCLGASNTRIAIDLQGNKRNDLNYPRMLSEVLGCTVRNYGVSGTNIALQEGRKDSYFERADAMEGGADIIIIQGGGNDATHGIPLGKLEDNDPYTYCGALRCLIQNLKRSHPQSKIVVSTSMRKKNEPKNRGDSLTHFDFYKAFSLVAKSEAVELIDFYNDPVLDPFEPQSMPDGLHMSESSCKYMSQIFADVIRNMI